MKICVVTHLYPGAHDPKEGFFIHMSMKALQALGHDIRVIYFHPLAPTWLRRLAGLAQKGKPLKSYVHENIPVTTVFYLPRVWHKAPALDAFLRQSQLKSAISHVFRDGLPDVVLGQQLFPDGVVVQNVKKHFNVPVLSMIRGDDVHTHPIQRDFMKVRLSQTFRAMDRIISVSEALAAEARKNFDSPNHPVSILYTASPLERFINRVPLRNPPRRLLFVGTLIPTKGTQELLKAVLEAFKHHPDLHLTIIGDGPDRAMLTEGFRLQGVLDRVEMPGFVPPTDMPDQYNRADILVFPSHCEGLPNSVVEAVATQRAVIATNVGGTREITTQNKAFRIVPPQNPQALTQSLLDLLSTDADTLRRDAQSGRLEVEKRFSPKTHGKTLESYLLDTIQSK